MGRAWAQSAHVIVYALSGARHAHAMSQLIGMQDLPRSTCTHAQVRETMAVEDRSMLAAAEARASSARMQPAIIVCHSMPTNW